MLVNEYGQMIGEPVDDTPGVLPSLVRIEGQYTIIEALSVEKHAEDLQEVALANEKVKAEIDGKEIVKVISVPNKLVNIVVK